MTPPVEDIPRLIERLTPGQHNTTIDGMVVVSMTEDAAREHVAVVTRLAAALTRRVEGDGFVREADIADIAKTYGLGTPESRAIFTALEHARANRALTPPASSSGEGDGLDATGASRSRKRTYCLNCGAPEDL